MVWDVVTAQSWLSIDLLREDSEQFRLHDLFLPLFPPFISSSQPTSFPAFVFPVLFLISLGKKRSKQVAVWGFTDSCGQYNIEFKEETWSCVERSLLFISALVLHFQMHSVLDLLQIPCRYEESLSIVTLHCKKLPCEV